MTDYDATQQAATLATAKRLGSHWTQAELDKLARLSGAQTDAVTAVELGRTLYGVRGARQNLAERTERAVNDRRYRKGGTALDDRGFTSLEDMGF